MSGSSVTGEAVMDSAGKGISGEFAFWRLGEEERLRFSGEGESKRLKDLDTCTGVGRGLAVCMLNEEFELFEADGQKHGGGREI